MLPELHVLLSDVDVWVIVSLFIHVTIVPFAIVRGFGLYAVVLSPAAPLTIETVDPDGDGAGEGDDGDDGVVGDELEAQAEMKTSEAMMNATRTDMQISLLFVCSPYRKRLAGSVDSIFLVIARIWTAVHFATRECLRSA
jgi:hypothetical protein